MQVVIIVVALLLALAPVVIIKGLSAGDSRSIRNTRRGLFILAVMCGGAAMGCWLLTQSDAGITPEEGPMTIATMYGSSLAFVSILVGSSFLGHGKQGLRVVLSRALFLIGIAELSVLLFFVVTSRGLILQFGVLPLLVLLVSLGCVVFSRRTQPSSN